NFHATAKRKYALRVGLLVGLAILIRPSEIIVILLPLLWGLEQINSDTLGRQIKFLKTNSKTVLLAVAAALFVVCIQVAYWLYVAGTPLVYSYGDKGFSWLSPHFFDFTFSYRSGWLVYTPLLIFAFLGMLVYLRYGKNKVAIISFFLLNYYVISAWDVWWYGGMGGRAMVQSYAVAFFMVAALVEWLFSTRWLKWPAFSLMALFAYVNIWFTYNAHAGQGLYDPNGMTKAYYWAVVGRFRVPKYKEKFKDTDEYFKGTPKNRKLLFSYGFEDDQTASDVNPISGKRSLFFYPYREFSPKLYFPLQPSEEDWLRAVARVRPLEQEWENWRMVQFIVGFNHHGEKIKDRMIRLNRFCPPGEITEVYFDIEIPDQPFDSVYILFWTPGSSSRIQIDEISVYSFME